MGSDTSCCGAHNGPVRSEETDSQLLKQNRINQLAPSKPMEHNYDTDRTNPGESKPMSSPQPSNSTQSNNTNKHKTIHHQPKPKKKKKKRKYNKVNTQIEILCSENAKAQSLLLCSKPEKIHRDGIVKEFGFLKYLNTNLSDKAVSELFSKFPSKVNNEYNEHALSVTQFVTLLTLVVIIYRVKLHQLRTGTKDKPPLNSEKIKTSVEHLAIWCIRTYGDKQNTRKVIKVYDDKGNEIKAQYYVYKFRLTQNDFSNNIYKWLKNYVDKEGQYSL